MNATDRMASGAGSARDQANSLVPVMSTVSWLTCCPPSDGNFRAHLATATRDDCAAALESDHLGKTARSAIERRLKRITTP